MIVNICFLDGKAERAYRKNARFCDICGGKLRQVNIREGENAELVMEELPDE